MAFISALPGMAQELISYNYGGLNYLIDPPSEDYVGYAEIVSYDGSTADVILPVEITYNGGSCFVNTNRIDPELFVGQSNIVTLKADFWNDELSFRGCSGLKTVVLPEDVDRIGNYQFYDCPSVDLKSIIGHINNIGDYAFAMSEPTELDLWDIVSLPYCSYSAFDNRLYTSLTLEFDDFADTATDIFNLLDMSAVRNMKCSHIEYLSLNESSFPALEKADIADGRYFSMNGIPSNLSEIKLSGNFESVEIYGDGIDGSAPPVNLDFSELSQTASNIALKGINCGNQVLNLYSAPESNVEIERLAGVRILNYNGGASEIRIMEMPDLLSVTATGAKQARAGQNPLLEKISLPDVEIIGSSAFEGNASLKELYVGDKLDRIDNYEILAGCTAMQDFIFGGTIEQWLAIDNEYTSGYNNSSMLFNVPSFWYGHGDARLTKLDELNSAHLMGVDVIKCGSFAGYKGLKKVIVPSSVDEIELRAFDYCSGIEEIDIDCRIISGAAFNGCTSIKKMTFGNNVKEIGSAFPSKLSVYPTVYYKGTPDQWNAIVKGQFTYTAEMYFNGTKYSDIVLHCPAAIGNGFQYSQWLNSVTIECGSDDIEIASYAFQASSLSKIGSTGGSRSAGEGGFVIGNGAFNSCRNLTDIGILKNAVSIGANALEGTAWFDSQQTQATLYIDIKEGKAAYKYLGTAPENTRIDIEDGTVEINPDAFWGQEGITVITLPPTLKRIGANAFTGTSVGRMVIPSSVEKADGSMLGNIAEFIIEDSSNALQGNTGGRDFELYGISTIYFGRDITDMSVIVHTGENSISMTFGKYVSVVNRNNSIPATASEVHVLAATPPACETETDRYDETYYTGLKNVDFDKCILYVPGTSLNDYRQAEGWSQFKNIREDFSGIEMIDSDEEDAQSEIYDLNGKRRNDSNLAPGIYLRHTGNKTEKFIVK